MILISEKHVLPIQLNKIKMFSFLFACALAVFSGSFKGIKIRKIQRKIRKEEKIMELPFFVGMVIKRTVFNQPHASMERTKIMDLSFFLSGFCLLFHSVFHHVMHLETLFPINGTQE